MTKVFLIVQDKDTDGVLSDVAQMGLLHPKHWRVPDSEAVQQARRLCAVAGRVLSALSRYEKKGGVAQPSSPSIEQWVNEIEQKLNELNQIKERLTRARAMLHEYRPWGLFDTDKIRALQQDGFLVQLIVIERSQEKNLPSDVFYHHFSQKGKIRYGVIVSRHPVEGPFTIVPWPSDSPRRLAEQCRQDEEAIERLEAWLAQAAATRPLIETAMDRWIENLRLLETREGRRVDDGLTVITGFCPTQDAPQFVETGRRKQWGVWLTEAQPQDHPPTLLKPPSWARVLLPIYAMINVYPGYDEEDITPVFLIFLTIFVGMLIGDAGYGLIYLALVGFFYNKLKHKKIDPRVWGLSVLLSVSVIVYGVLSGTFFGQQWIQSWFQPVVPVLNDPVFVQGLCFLLGAVHLSLAHLWRCAKRWPQPSWLSQIGWGAIVWGMYFLAEVFVLNKPFGRIAAGLITIGAVLVVGFTRAEGRLASRLGAGLGELLLNIVNSFTDVISYIRLFAVGLATIAVADAANDLLRVSVSQPTVLNIFIGLIAFALHPLNVILAVMAILVHGLRLNVLEFTNHMGMEWRGFPYRPLRRMDRVS